MESKSEFISYKKQKEDEHKLFCKHWSRTNFSFLSAFKVSQKLQPWFIFVLIDLIDRYDLSFNEKLSISYISKIRDIYYYNLYKSDFEENMTKFIKNKSKLWQIHCSFIFQFSV